MGHTPPPLCGINFSTKTNCSLTEPSDIPINEECVQKQNCLFISGGCLGGIWGMAVYLHGSHTKGAKDEVLRPKGPPSLKSDPSGSLPSVCILRCCCFFLQKPNCDFLTICQHLSPRQPRRRGRRRGWQGGSWQRAARVKTAKLSATPHFLSGEKMSPREESARGVGRRSVPLVLTEMQRENQNHHLVHFSSRSSYT